MPFTRPTLAQIDERIKADITFRMGVQSSLLRRAWVSIFSRALAGAMHLLYGFMEWAYKQFFADTAERDALLAKGKVYNLTLKPAEYANGYVAVTGINGTLIPVGTIFKRADGARYAVDVAHTLVGTSGNVHVRAELAGALYNLASGQPVALESPIIGVTTDAVVAASTPGPIENGFDEEGIEAFRARYLLRVRNPPQGGAKADYESWAMEVAGVGKAFVYTPQTITGDEDHPVLPGGSIKPPIGQVWVYIQSTDPLNPTPSGAVQIAVQAYLDERKSATAIVVVFAVVPKIVDFNIEVGLTSGYSGSEAQAEITAELVDLFLREAFPFTTIRLSQINEAISNAGAESFHTTLAPVADIDLLEDEVGQVGTITITII